MMTGKIATLDNAAAAAPLAVPTEVSHERIADGAQTGTVPRAYRERQNSTNEPSADPLKPSQGRQSDSPHDAARWVAEHWDAIYNLLYRLTSAHAHDTEDLAQETFLRAMERYGSFKPGTNLRAWLMRIATNAFLDRQRRRKVMKLAPMPEDELAPPAATVAGAASAPGQGLEAREAHASVERAIAELPETQRVIFVLRTLEELSFREIAQTLGTTEETARWHMMQARRQLLTKLDGKV
jgi:RNA polymerase sigma-70 factor (ECF subfamily)